MKKVLFPVTIILIIVSLSITSSASQFIDIKEEDWYHTSIASLYNDGIVSGYPDGSFRPDNQVTVGEFLAMVYSSLGEKETPSTGNQEQHWAYDIIKKAIDDNILDFVAYLRDDCIVSENASTDDIIAAIDLDKVLSRNDAVKILAYTIREKDKIYFDFEKNEVLYMPDIVEIINITIDANSGLADFEKDELKKKVTSSLSEQISLMKSKMPSIKEQIIGEFRDISSEETEVIFLYFLEVASGYSDGTFKGSKPVSRAEACTLILNYIKVRENIIMAKEEILQNFKMILSNFS